jgi:hypothetical protein
MNLKFTFHPARKFKNPLVETSGRIGVRLTDFRGLSDGAKNADWLSGAGRYFRLYVLCDADGIGTFRFPAIIGILQGANFGYTCFNYDLKNG